MEGQKAPIQVKAFDFTSLVIGVIVILITFVLLAIYKRTKAAKRGLLITGLSDSGKTLVFARLVFNKYAQTQTSMKENIADYTVDNSSNTLRVIDIPGHERLRDKFLDENKTIARALIYVIDSSNITKDIRDVAEYLYNILTDPIISKNVRNLLILCNKQDQSLSKSSEAIRSMLEKELNTLRLTKSKQLDSVDPKAKRAAVLGDGDKNFEFSSLNVKVDFAQCYANNRNMEADLSELRKWLEGVA